MLSDSKKISIRQAGFLFITYIFTTSINLIPIYTSIKAKQGAWLAPIGVIGVFILLSFIWQGFYKQYTNSSLMEIYTDITGRFVGKVLIILHLFWMFLLTSLYLRILIHRLVESIYANVNMDIFAIPFLIVIVYTLRFGLVPLARFNEIVFPLLALVFYMLVALILPNIKIKFLTPVTYRSIIPIFQGGVGILGVFAYFTLLFIVGDKINNKEKIVKTTLQISIFLVLSLTAIISVAIGVFSYKVAQRVHLPFLIAVKQISLFNTLEKIESAVLPFWLLSDFVLICFFMICTLSLLQYLFNLSSTQPFINIYGILLFILSNLVANNFFEIQYFFEDFMIYVNIFFGFILPTLILIIGKIRKKV
ncbi:MAG TPA: GerAB/ArcD/ProY family transporter [Eubacteriaceae bacterium]|nr:GerAB/ArcD/ProY family transporter [Eubacteriaceae bacterium]